MATVFLSIALVVVLILFYLSIQKQKRMQSYAEEVMDIAQNKMAGIVKRLDKLRLESNILDAIVNVAERDDEHNQWVLSDAALLSTADGALASKCLREKTGESHE